MALKRKPPKGNVRNVHSNGKTITGVIVNNQNEIVQFESGSEEILPLIFLRDKTIKRLVSQPLTITYFDKDYKSHTYTPDFLIERNDGSIEIHEFTITNRQHKLPSIEREAAAKKYCVDRGWKYVVHNELEFPSPTWIDNIQALHGFNAQVYNNEMIRSEIMALLNGGEKVFCSSITSEIQNKLGLEKRVINGAIFHMLYWKDINTDLNKLLFIQGHPNQNMRLWLDMDKENCYGY